MFVSNLRIVRCSLTTRIVVVEVSAITIVLVSMSAYDLVDAPDNSSFCESVNLGINAVCFRDSGYYCPTTNYTRYKEKDIYFINTPQGELSYAVNTSYTPCSNQTLILICPDGFYCPDSFTKIECPSGKYCGKGFVKPHDCSWGLISCPHEGMAVQYIAVLLLMFTFFLGLALFCFYRREKKIYDAHDGTLDSISNHEAARQFQLLQEQQRTNEMLDSLGIAQEQQNGGASVLGHLHLTPRSSASSSSDSSAATSTRDIASVPSSSNLKLLPHHKKRPSQSEVKAVERAERMLEHEKKLDEFVFKPIEEPLTISFSKLCLRLKLPPHDLLLNNIFGTIKPFQITALMGPSGAGKTTLMNLLRGQAHYANCYGLICVNGMPVPSLAAFRSDMAFVPQDDVVYEELTVEDNILYSAMLFNRRGLINSLDVLPMVSRAEKMVGIDFIRHSIVGGLTRKGISGGQRKRVSIAMEMMKEAALFFLDEPTSGLDSATSISVLHCLKELSLLGYNIVATLHQPRQEILDLLDNLILIAPGGRLVFNGPPRRLRDHFMQFGFTPGPHCNMADFMMDCLAGFVVPMGSNKHPDVNSTIKTLCDWWQKNKESSQSQKEANRLSRRRRITIVHNNAGDDAITLFFKTYYVASARQKKIYYRTFHIIVETCALLAFSGMAVGFLMNTVRLHDFSSPNVVQQAITGQLIFAIFITNSSLKLFGGDHLMRIREEEGGVWLLPLFLGKVTSSYVEYLFYSYAFLCGYYSVIASNTAFYNYWGIFLLLHMALYSLSNLVSILVTGKMKDLIMLGVLVVLWLFGGVQPPYPQLAKDIPVIGPIMNALSPFRWSFQLLIVVELNGYSDVWAVIVDGVYARYGYSHEYIFQAGMLLVYNAACNLLAYLALALKRDNYLIVHLLMDKARKRIRRLRGLPEPFTTSNSAQMGLTSDTMSIDQGGPQSPPGFQAVSTDDMELVGFPEVGVRPPSIHLPKSTKTGEGRSNRGVSFASDSVTSASLKTAIEGDILSRREDEVQSKV